MAEIRITTEVPETGAEEIAAEIAEAEAGAEAETETDEGAELQRIVSETLSWLLAGQEVIVSQLEQVKARIPANL